MSHPIHRNYCRQPRRADVKVEAQLGPKTLAAVILAASVIAQADGAAEPCERRALLAFLREQGLLTRYGRTAVLASYVDALGRVHGRGLIGAVDALDPLTRLAGAPSAHLIAAAAREVALADGVEWPQETALLGVISDRLGLRSRRVNF